MITKKEKEILDIIKDFINKNGYSPTIREIGGIAKLKSPSTVYSHLINLRKKGYINYMDGKMRTISVMEVE